MSIHSQNMASSFGATHFNSVKVVECQSIHQLLVLFQWLHCRKSFIFCQVRYFWWALKTWVWKQVLEQVIRLDFLLLNKQVSIWYLIQGLPVVDFPFLMFLSFFHLTLHQISALKHAPTKIPKCVLAFQFLSKAIAHFLT